MSFACPSCAKTWLEKARRDQHVADTGHRKPLAVALPDTQFDCETCPRHFKNQEAVDQHMDDLGHRKSLAVTLPAAQFGCDTCIRHFKSRKAVDQHMKALRHRKLLTVTLPSAQFGCNTCSRHFKSREAVDQHMKARHRTLSSMTLPAAQFSCDTCVRHFKSWEAVDQHMNGLGHRKPSSMTLPAAQFSCDTCIRHFKNRGAVDQHMDDLGHRKQLPIGQLNDDLTGYESLVSHICPKYLTQTEVNEIRVQFDGVWQENNQVLWSGTDYSKTKEWASQNGFQTLTICMGPLMEPGNAKCRRNSSFRAWKLYMRGASALFAWRISQGRSTTVLTPPPPHRYHPSGITNYQDIERPIIQGVLGDSVDVIMMVHPEVSGAEQFAYEAWPNDQHTSWVAKFGKYPDRNWRIVSKKRVPMSWQAIGHVQLRPSSEDNCQITQSQGQPEDELELHQSMNDQRSEIQPKKLRAIEGSQTINDSHGFMVLTLKLFVEVVLHLVLPFADLLKSLAVQYRRP